MFIFNILKKTNKKDLNPKKFLINIKISFTNVKEVVDEKG
jgi:hypothetical protein